MKKKLFAILTIMAMLFTLPSCDSKHSRHHHDDEDEDEKTEKVDERDNDEGVSEVTAEQTGGSSAVVSAKLQDIIDQANKVFPMDLGMGISMDKVTAEGDYVVFTIVCPNTLYQSIASQKETFVKGVKESMSTNDMSVFKDEGKGVKYIIRNSDTGAQTYVEIPAKDL